MFYVVSDVHSNYRALKKILDKLDNNKDQLFINGDILDRGNDGFKILDEIMNKNNVHLILGNHELALINVYLANKRKNDKQFEVWKEYWFEGGGRKSFQYFFNDLNEAKRNEYIKYLLSCSYDELVKVKGKYFYIVHACPSNDIIEKTMDRRHIFGIIEDDLDILIEDNEVGYNVVLTKLSKIDKELLINDEDKKFIINPTVIVGHNPTKYIQSKNPCEIWKTKHIINIDCGSNGYYDKEKDDQGYIGRLACLCLNTMNVEYY